jgi:Rps23 Pro-64 3,4-dihydroxylase Tpa1-like proline 4-hydroxylase
MEDLFTDKFLRKLQSLAQEKSHEYQTNAPFPNIYLDEFLPVNVVEAALREFPERTRVRWTEFDDHNQVKLAFDTTEKLPPPIRDILYFLNSRPMMEFLEVLTGISGVIPDPYFYGGGLHQIVPGGYLEVHADFNRHEKLRLDRRLNLLLYLNQDWKEDYGGHLELWNREMTGSVRKILPIFNRCAIFSTTDTSFHGHPEPLACPPGRTRKSIATYYYSNGRPESEVSDGHTTLFQHRPGVAKHPVNVAKHPVNVKTVIRAITPPILLDAARRLRRTKIG